MIHKSAMMIKKDSSLIVSVNLQNDRLHSKPKTNVLNGIFKLSKQ